MKNPCSTQLQYNLSEVPQRIRPMPEIYVLQSTLTTSTMKLADFSLIHTGIAWAMSLQCDTAGLILFLKTDCPIDF